MSFLNRLMGMLQGALLGNDRQMGKRFRGRNVRPASEDPYGDPADQMGGMGRMGMGGRMPGNGRFGNVKPASQDPYGDPADQMGAGRFGNVKPASQDPYGDPADDTRSWRR